MIPSLAISAAHMECRSLEETIPVMTDFLAFEQVGQGRGAVTLKHPNTDWLLTVHEGGAVAPSKQMHNHFGVRVESKVEVDAAHQYVTAHKDEYGIYWVGDPAFSHGSYSVYFLEPGSNGWEIECYQDVLRKESGGERLGGVRSRHWEAPLPPERFPGRGYVPQAFTHGTLACADVDAAGRFYSQVLGLEVVRAYARVIYVKHAAKKHYIVCQAKEEWNTYSPNFRFTLSVASPDEVATSYAWLEERGGELGLRELGEVEADDNLTSFTLADPDGNWWEIASPS